MSIELNSNLMLKDYGYIRIKLGALLKEKGITAYYLSKVSQVSYPVVRRWCSCDKMEKLDTDVLARFCYVLDCDLGTIIQEAINGHSYTKDKDGKESWIEIK